MINNSCCVNGRLLIVRYRTITTRAIYCTVCALCRTTIVTVSITLSHSILYYMAIVGNYQNSALVWSKIIYNLLQNLFDKIIVFQIDLSSIYHSFCIFMTIVYRGYIYIFYNIVFILFALTSSTR